MTSILWRVALGALVAGLFGATLIIVWQVGRRWLRRLRWHVAYRLNRWLAGSARGYYVPPADAPYAVPVPPVMPIPPSPQWRDPATDRIGPAPTDEPTTDITPPAPATVVVRFDEAPANVAPVTGPPPTASLRAIRGSALDVLLTSSTVTIGRGTDRDILLDAGTVSRRHCTLRFMNGRWHLQDDDSPNGTFVNGTRLAAGAQAPLSSGDRIGLGDDVLLKLTASRIEHRDLCLTVGTATDKGGRPRNEDSLCATESVIAVADGVGGRPGGDIASGIAVSLARSASAGLPLEHLVPAMNEAIKSRGRDDTKLHEMATTFEGVQLVVDNSGAVMRGVHIGDGCALLDDGTHIKNLTVPHTLGGRLAKEGNPAAARHPDRARLLRVLGTPAVPEFDRWEERAVVGHRYVLSTDGVLNALNQDELRAALEALRGIPPELAARTLVETILHRTTRDRLDNLTVVIADLRQKVDNSGSASPAVARPPQQRMAIGR